MNRGSLPAAAFLLLIFTVLVSVVEARHSAGLRRHKREWIIPPQKLDENVDYTKKEFIAKIRSDSDDGTGNVQYSLTGVGASNIPYHLFIVNPDTGFVSITGILDRETIAMYNLSGTAKFTNGIDAEKNIDLRIQVVDQNDNPPIFGDINPGEVYELSPTDTSIMTLTATDADEPGNENSKIAYTIIKQEPPGESMFHITKDGVLKVKKPTLDREVQDWYMLTVKGTDLYGRPEGNTGTGTFRVNIKDVNDNPPTLEKDEYEGSIEENTENMEVMRFKAEDMDMENTPNWAAQFEIVKGNEAGYFSIETDPKTNEGVLILKKAVDYEDVKHLELGIAVANQAPPYNGEGGGGGGGSGTGGGGGGGGGSGTGGGGGSGGSSGGSSGGGSGGGSSGGSGGGGGGSGGGGGGSWFGGGGSTGKPMKTYPVKIAVKNQPEGPRFDPKVKAIPISEGGDFNINKVIGSYHAIDGDTLMPAQNVRYAKGSDPDNWLTVDELTGDIKLNKMPDRESKFLVNGTYYAKVLCMTQDMPSKTATGTVAIQVEDLNDHCPTLTSKVQTMCMTADAITVTAVDKDVFPNGAPFTFTIIPEGTEGVWVVEHLNDTSTILRSQKDLWPGSYAVAMEIRDQQGHACPDLQKLKVDVCTCADKGKACATRGVKGSTGAVLGPAAIGLLFLGLLTLLLIPLLLLFCTCGGAGGLPGGFTEMPFDAKAQLISYHTEGQGENTEVPLLNTPVQVDTGRVKMVNAGTIAATAGGAGLMIGGGQFQNSSSTMGGGFYQSDGLMDIGYNNGGEIIGHGNGGGFYSEYESREGGGAYEGIALPDHYLEEYYSQKAHCAAENHVQKDSMLVYDYEGQGSPVGSVGCCSLLESDNDLQFLNDIGPKFKTLAEVCRGERFQTEVSAPLPPRPIISMPTAASSVTTNVASRLVSAAPVPAPAPASAPAPAPASAPAPAPAPPPAPAQVTHVERAVVRESDRLSTLRQDMVGGSQGQTFLLQQQPMYYTTMQPMMQPVVQQMHYVVEQQVPNIQGMIMVNGPPSGSAQGLVLQGQQVVTGTQAQGTLGRGEGGLIHMGNMSGSQGMMVVDGPVMQGGQMFQGGQMLQGGQVFQGGQVLQGGQLVQGGQVLQGGQAWLQQSSSLQRGGLSGSQSMLVMEGQGGISGGSGVQKGQGGVLGFSQGSMQRNGLSGSHRVLYTTEQSSAAESSAGSQSGIVGLNGFSSKVSVGPASSSRKAVIEKRVVTNQSTSK